MRNKLQSLAVAIGLLFAAMPALAHHSFTAEFIPEKQIELKGHLTTIDWINPHIYYHLDVTDEKGEVSTWLIESFNPSWYHRAGISREMLGEGQVVTITAYPAKDGTRNLGFFRKITFADGHEIMMH